jgi:hypothetical protein
MPSQEMSYLLARKRHLLDPWFRPIYYEIAQLSQFLPQSGYASGSDVAALSAVFFFRLLSGSDQ